MSMTIPIQTRTTTPRLHPDDGALLALLLATAGVLLLILPEWLQ